MKRILRFVVRVYPRRWKERYGAEFDALLEEATPCARDVFDVLCGGLAMQMTRWGRGRIMLTYGLAGIIIGCMLSFLIPGHYVSTTRLTVTPAETGSTPFAPYSMNDFAHHVFDRETLASIIQRYHLYGWESGRTSIDDEIVEMRKNIRISPIAEGASAGTQKALAFSVQFDYSDAGVARQVNEDLIFRLLQGNVEDAQRNPQAISHATFSVLDPPRLSAQSTSANRPWFIGIGLLAGLAMAAIRRSQSGPSIRPA